ncbi:MAG: hypothetical protein ACEQR8_02625 [Cypionkella sp.]
MLSVAGHHTHVEASTVLWRDDAGRWWRDQIAVTSGALIPMAPRLDRSERALLAAPIGERLDALLAARALYAEVAPSKVPDAVGAAYHTMEIVSPRGHTVLRWAGRLEGRAGEIADIAFTRPARR